MAGSRQSGGAARFSTGLGCCVLCGILGSASLACARHDDRPVAVSRPSAPTPALPPAGKVCRPESWHQFEFASKEPPYFSHNIVGDNLVFTSSQGRLTGRIYNLHTGTWRSISKQGAPTTDDPEGRELVHVSRAIDDVLLVLQYVQHLGGVARASVLSPASNTWKDVDVSEFPSSWETELVVGSAWVVWPRVLNVLTDFRHGWKYDASTNRSSPISDIGAPSQRQGFALVSTGGSHDLGCPVPKGGVVEHHLVGRMEVST